jgi:hypothetical protein
MIVSVTWALHLASTQSENVDIELGFEMSSTDCFGDVPLALPYIKRVHIGQSIGIIEARFDYTRYLE